MGEQEGNKTYVGDVETGSDAFERFRWEKLSHKLDVARDREEGSAKLCGERGQLLGRRKGIRRPRGAEKETHRAILARPARGGDVRVDFIKERRGEKRGEEGKGG